MEMSRLGGPIDQGTGTNKAEIKVYDDEDMSYQEIFHWSVSLWSNLTLSSMCLKPRLKMRRLCQYEEGSTSFEYNMRPWP